MGKVLYLSNTCSDKEYRELYRSVTKLVAQQGTKFNKLFAEGISKNDVPVELISARPVNQKLLKKKCYKAKTEKENGVIYHYLPFVNVKYIRQIMVYIAAQRKIRRWIRQNPNGVIICDILNYSLFRAVSTLNRKNVKLIGIVTDLPEILSNGNISKRIIRHNRMIAECDGLVLLAEEMTNKINPYNKPYIVMEGFCDIKMQNSKNVLENKYDKKVVLYAGLLHKKYGIENLTKAFVAANIPNSELHIYGTGDFEEELKEIVKKCDNVKYFGTKDNAYVVDEQLKATLLVNPRPTNEEFVKYSFPSKNMEYVVSGTPMLTTDLPSMPKEYKNHCFVLNGYDINSIETALKEVLSMSKEELHDFGANAKNWILQNKNNVVQTQKVMNFVKNLR